MTAANSVTILDVARMAGVSKGTVSRAINNVPGVSANSVAAIRKAMTELNYEPPPLERRRGPRSRMRFAATPGQIALLLLGRHDLKWIFDHQPVYSSVIHGVGEALAARNLNLIVRHVARHADLPEVLRLGRWEGLVLFGVEPDDPAPPELRRLPAVWAMGSPQRFPGDHVLPNHLMTGTLAAEHLLSRQHARCAVLADAMNRGFAPQLHRVDRAAAFRYTIERAGGQVQELIDGELLGPENQLDEQRLGALIDRFAAASPRPTGLFLTMDVFAPSVYRLLNHRGIQPGKDVQIVTCNNERPYLMGLRPSPTVVDIHADYIGKRAVERLLWHMKHPTEPAEKVLIAPSIAESGT